MTGFQLVPSAELMTTMRLYLLALGVLMPVMAGCGDDAPPGPTGDPEAVALIEAARQAHGASALNHAEVRFSFRGTPFTLERHGGRFRYARTRTDSLGRSVTEVVDNNGTRRLVEGGEEQLSEAERQAVATAVNSVAYFALLPYPLADPAVQARALGRDSVEGAPYEAVEVTFAQDGGGADWEDRYLVWLHPERHTMDYLAYTYEPTPGDTSRTETGHRFRRVIGVTEIPVDGDTVRFQDYANLTADSLAQLEDYPEALAAGRTIPVSEVILDSVRVEPL